MSDSKILTIRSAMVRKLEDMNLRSVLAGEDNGDERLSCEISIRRLDGVLEVRYWELYVPDKELLPFRRALTGWSTGHPRYQCHVRIITHLDSDYRLIEAPLQVASALTSWLTFYWGGDFRALSNPPSRSLLLRSLRSSVS